MQQLVKPDLTTYLKTASVIELAKHYNIYRPIEKCLLSTDRFRSYNIRQILWHICMIYNPKLYIVIGYSFWFLGKPKDEYLMRVYEICQQHNL